MRISDWSSDVCSSDLRGKHWPWQRVSRSNRSSGKLWRPQVRTPRSPRSWSAWARTRRRRPGHKRSSPGSRRRRRFAMIARKQRWLAMDVSGDVVDMDDFDEDEASAFLDGKCFALAYAIHRLTGWTIEGKIERSEEHTSELQSLMRTSYAVSCFKKKKTH